VTQVKIPLKAAKTIGVESGSRVKREMNTGLPVIIDD
jgi:hypothetical protein